MTGSSCIDVLNAQKMQINKSKKFLKGVSLMSSGSINYIDGLKDSNYCVIPKEGIGILNMDGGCRFARRDASTGAILKTYDLTKTSAGTLPLDPSQHTDIIKSGNSIYPVEGCAKEMNDAVDVNTFLLDIGEILDNQAIAYAKSLDAELAILKNQCSNLDTDINLATSSVSSKTSELKTETGKCNLYVSQIPYYIEENKKLRQRIKDRKAATERENARIAAEALRKRNSVVSNVMGSWYCIPGINTPLRRNVQGDIECMSFDGRNCMWDNCSKNRMGHGHHSHRPLTCGDMHARIYGSPGYNHAGHWCQRGANALDSNFNVVRIWQHCNYNGWYVDVPKGKYFLHDLLPKAFTNDDASSIQFLRPGVGRVVMWEHNFSGRRVDATSNIDCFVWRGFNDMMSSIEIFI